MGKPSGITRTSAANRESLRNAFDDLALFLVDHGITVSEVQSAITDAFIQAAVTRARMKNGRVNQSRVAIMTGLSRTEVRKLLASGKDELRIQAARGAQKVLEGWSRDTEFCSKDGRPMRLSTGTGYGSFTNLARRYSGDIPPRATLAELLRLKAAEVSGDFVKRKPMKDADLRRRQHTLANAAAQLSILFQLMGYPEALTPALKLYDGVSVSVADNAALRIAEQRVGQSARAFLNGIEHSAKALLRRQRNRTKAVLRRIVVNVSVSTFLPRT